MDSTEREVWDALRHHLQTIFEGDIDGYTETTSADLSLYEWWVTPHRQDGLEFHLYMLRHRVLGSSANSRFDLLEPRLQLYEHTAIASYTMLISSHSEDGKVTHRAHNESRVLVKRDGRWQVVHVHKSPAYPAPRTAGGE